MVTRDLLTSLAQDVHPARLQLRATLFVPLSTSGLKQRNGSEATTHVHYKNMLLFDYPLISIVIKCPVQVSSHCARHHHGIVKWQDNALSFTHHMLAQRFLNSIGKFGHTPIYSEVLPHGQRRQQSDFAIDCIRQHAPRHDVRADATTFWRWRVRHQTRRRAYDELLAACSECLSVAARPIQRVCGVEVDASDVSVHACSYRFICVYGHQIVRQCLHQ
ncbi:hypothetical protein EGJ89_09945 [Stenotrophomonas maltophilia]|nr:hypothetical protein EGJ89_09945 [Stenotrophomonas maltophilia]